MFRVGSPKVVIFGCILGRGWHTICKSPELCGPCTLCRSYSGLLLSPQSIPRQHVSDESGRVPFTRSGGPGLADPCCRSPAQKLGVAGDLNHCLCEYPSSLSSISWQTTLSLLKWLQGCSTFWEASQVKQVWLSEWASVPLCNFSPLVLVLSLDSPA